MNSWSLDTGVGRNCLLLSTSLCIHFGHAFRDYVTVCIQGKEKPGVWNRLQMYSEMRSKSQNKKPAIQKYKQFTVYELWLHVCNGHVDVFFFTCLWYVHFQGLFVSNYTVPILYRSRLTTGFGSKVLIVLFARLEIFLHVYLYGLLKLYKILCHLK